MPRQFKEKLGGHDSGVRDCAWDQEAGRKWSFEKALVLLFHMPLPVQKAVMGKCEKAMNSYWELKSKSEPSSAVF